MLVPVLLLLLLAPCNKAAEAYPCAPALPLGSVYVRLPRDLYSNKAPCKKWVKYVKEKHRACPSTTTVNKGTRFESAQTVPSANFGSLIYRAVTPPRP